MEHYLLLIEHLGENRATNVMKGLLLTYTKRLPCRRFLKGLILEIDGREKLISILNQYFGYLREEIGGEG